MKKVVAISSLLIVALIMGSCGSSNNVVSNRVITKRKYTKGFHINKQSNLKSDKTEGEDVAVTPEAPKKTMQERIADYNTSKGIQNTQNKDQEESLATNNELKATDSKELIASDWVPAKIADVVNTIVPHKTDFNIIVQEENGDYVPLLDEELGSNNEVSYGGAGTKTASDLKNQVKEAKAKQQAASGGNSSILNIVLIVLLVLAIILLISLLPGWVGWILSLVLLVVLIVLLLRLLGVM